MENHFNESLYENEKSSQSNVFLFTIKISLFFNHIDLFVRIDLGVSKSKFFLS